MQAPANEQLAEKMKDVKFLKLDVDQNPKIAEHFKIMSIPTMMVFKDGQVVGQTFSFHPKDQTRAFIEHSLQNNASVD